MTGNKKRKIRVKKIDRHQKLTRNADSKLQQLEFVNKWPRIPDMQHLASLTSCRHWNSQEVELLKRHTYCSYCTLQQLELFRHCNLQCRKLERQRPHLTRR